MLGAQNIVCSVDKYIDRLWKLESEKYIWIHLWKGKTERNWAIHKAPLRVPKSTNN